MQGGHCPHTPSTVESLRASFSISSLCSGHSGTGKKPPHPVIPAYEPESRKINKGTPGSVIKS